jgi:hypothetical protein
MESDQYVDMLFWTGLKARSRTATSKITHSEQQKSSNSNVLPSPRLRCIHSKPSASWALMTRLSGYQISAHYGSGHKVVISYAE